MQQSLENVISKLQKIYQLKSLELEKIHEELELRKIATVLANFKDSDELASYDIEKVKKFLSKSNSGLDLDTVVLACTIVSMSTPIIKTSKRYVEASAVLATIKAEAMAYIETKDDLFIKQTRYENLLQIMEELFNVLTNKVVVEADALEKYIKLLKEEIFNDDMYSVLVVVAALVIRNATILSKPETVAREQEESLVSTYKLNERQEEQKVFYSEFIKKEEYLYESKLRGMVTNTYLKNIEVLVEKKKISLDEVKNMLKSDSNLYEYFIWNWMNRLVDKLGKVTSEKSADELISQLDKLYKKYLDLFERRKINNTSKDKIKNNKRLIYFSDKNNEEDMFDKEEVTLETLELIEQIKTSKDVKSMKNIMSLDNDLILLMGEQEFILFKILPRNHILVLLNGKIEDMDKKLDTKMLEKLTRPNYFNGITKAIAENSMEYRELIQASEKLEKRLLGEDSE